MDQSRLEIRPDIREKHHVLLGEHLVHGRRVNVEKLIEELTEATRDEFSALLRRRHVVQDEVGSGQQTYDFLPADTQVSDADGHTATVGQIRQGMLDGFFGRNTPHAWQLNPSVPMPADTLQARPRRHGAGH